MTETGPAEVLAATVNTQPVMLTAAYAMYRALDGRNWAAPPPP